MSTFSLSGTSSVLKANYSPPIDLRDDYGEYVVGLISLETFNAIPNIDKSNNKFYVGNAIISIPVGTYEISALEEHLQESIRKLNKSDANFNCVLSLNGNTSTLKCELKCTHKVDFSKKNSLGKLLGFNNMVLDPNIKHVSVTPVNILKVNVIKVECNIVTGAYHNNKLVHTIHKFSPSVPAGFKIIEIPSNVIYMPINTRLIDNIELRLVDQDGDILNFREEVITVRLHLKKLT